MDGLSAMHIHYLVKEFSSLVNARIKKVYQLDPQTLIFQIKPFRKPAVILLVSNGKAYLTMQAFEAPKKPSGFSMQLRKHLSNAPVQAIKQPGFERIIEIHTPNNKLIIELLSPSNIMLLDSNNTILGALESRKFNDREIANGIAYQYPPLIEDPFSMDLTKFSRMALASDRHVASFLAVSLGLGGIFATELCALAGIEGRQTSKLLDRASVEKLFNSLQGMAGMEMDPCIYENFVSPFPLTTLGAQSEIHAGTLSEALNTYFSSKEPAKEEDPMQKRIEWIEKERLKAKEKWAAKEVQTRTIAEIIYANYDMLNDILQGIRIARQNNMDWAVLKQRAKSETSPAAKAIVDIREHDGIVVVQLEGKNIELDFTKTVEQNAASHFETAKKAKRKIAGIEKSLETPLVSKEKKSRPRAAPKKWFERFRHFTTTDGFLVIAGKSSQENETIFKKYLKKGDLAFHADIQGAGLVAIRSDNKPISPEAKREAAEFSAIHSKAWKAQVGNINVYSVNPEQLGKKDPEGHPLPPGGFSLSGAREWYRDIELKMAIGIKVDRAARAATLIYGPVIATRRHAQYFITIKPGTTPAPELARLVKNRLLMRSSVEDKPMVEAIPQQEIEAIIPSGVGSLIDFG